MIFRKIFMSLLIFLASTFALASAEELVKAKLLADVQGVASGQTFRLGVLFQMQPEWHIYWKDAGDAGLPTQINFILPDGFNASELRWPIHKSWMMPGEIQSHGYDGEVLLSSKVTAPPKLESGEKIQIRAMVRWLACKDVCIPGKTELELALPVTEELKSDNLELFSAWEVKLPQQDDNP